MRIVLGDRAEIRGVNRAPGLVLVLVDGAGAIGTGSRRL
jgi:hypothetical protein